MKKYIPLLGTLALAVSYHAQAANLNVTNPDDLAPGLCDTDCTLREAIIEANGNADPSNTIFLPAGTYKLSLEGLNEDAAATGDLDITKDLSIIGDGAALTIIDANGIDRIFHVNTPVIEFNLQGLSLKQGNPTLASEKIGGAILFKSEGGILNIDACELSNNTATLGGGILADANTNQSSLIGIRNSAFIHNEATSNNGYGGAVTIIDAESAIVNSTFSDNQARRGGAIAAASFGFYSSVSIGSSTLTLNRANDAVNPLGSALYAFSAFGDLTNIVFSNSIIANNPSSSDWECGIFNNAQILSEGFNLIRGFGGNNTPVCNVTAEDKVVLDFSLPSLANNGGPTPTHALGENSPALNSANPMGCADYVETLFSGNQAYLVQDQRGQDRVIGNRCDIGAFESGASADLSLQIVAGTEKIKVGVPFEYSLKVKNSGPQRAFNVVLNHNLAEGLTFISVHSDHESDVCTQNGGAIACQLSDLANSEEHLITVTAQLDALPQNNLVNSANVDSPEDKILGNNSTSLKINADKPIDNEDDGEDEGDGEENPETGSGGCSLNVAASSGSWALSLWGLSLAAFALVRSKKMS